MLQEEQGFRGVDLDSSTIQLLSSGPVDRGEGTFMGSLGRSMPKPNQVTLIKSRKLRSSSEHFFSKDLRYWLGSVPEEADGSIAHPGKKPATVSH